jgi:hypothetical protein
MVASGLYRAGTDRCPFAALKERLGVASERHALLSQQIDFLQPELDRVKGELAQLKASPDPTRINAFAGTAGTIFDRIAVISVANTALGQSLTPTGAMTHNPPTELQSLTSHEQLLYAKLLIDGWILNFNPASTRASKRISFNDDGSIREGKNKNEFRWQISSDLLAIYRENGSLQNKFRYDEETNRFICINDSNAKGIKDQIIYYSLAMFAKLK